MNDRWKFMRMHCFSIGSLTGICKDILTVGGTLSCSVRVNEAEGSGINKISGRISTQK
ncbi:MAG: hypothetical protein J6K48_05660 [Lachnospiraceae bacterium]|nr:hypothetical protein [Lachnospiraceae bacterium]